MRYPGLFRTPLHVARKGPSALPEHSQHLCKTGAFLSLELGKPFVTAVSFSTVHFDMPVPSTTRCHLFLVIFSVEKSYQFVIIL